MHPKNKPAFPRPAYSRPDRPEIVEPGDKGMLLRDWFAGQALAGLIHRGFTELGNSESMYAHLAYDYADAMLKARGGE